ncbi:hypothetical protein BGW39_001635, partial [Mortierella sp. 14UC]
ETSLAKSLGAAVIGSSKTSCHSSMDGGLVNDNPGPEGATVDYNFIVGRSSVDLATVPRPSGESVSPLKRFHFSLDQYPTANEEQELEILAICSTAQYTIIPHYLSPQMAKYFRERQIALMTLDILRHHTLKMPYMTYYMDLHQHTRMYGEALPFPVAGGWVYRGLESLHMDLHIHEHATTRGSHHTRIAYGYIARVCPRLQDLRIRFPTSCKVHNGYINWRQHPFNTGRGGGNLLKGGHGDLSRKLIWRRIASRTTKVDLNLFSMVFGIEFGMDTAAEEVLANLASLGLLQDVKDMMDEMDKHDYVCLPSLQLLACGNYLAQRPEKEMWSQFYFEPPVFLGAFQSTASSRYCSN